MLSNSKLAALWLFFILLCGAALLKQTLLQPDFPLQTDVLALLPENQQDPVAQQAFGQIAANLSNKVVFLFASDDKAQLVDGVKAFSEKLLQTELFAQFSAQLSEQDQQSWGKLYFPYRAQLLNEAQRAVLKNSPQSQVTKVLQQVYTPFSGVTGSELKDDPFLLFRDFISGQGAASNFTLEQGYLATSYQGKHYIILHAELLESPYNMDLQSKIKNLTTLEKEIKTRFGLQILHTGTLFYAAYGTQSAVNEISTIGIGSLAGIILLILLVYRSVLPLALALLSISCGLLVAFVVTVAVFGKVHLFSLVFGASLIGVSIDYAFHYLTERLVSKDNWQPDLALKHIFNAITLGLLTSLIGYLGLLIAPFPGLQQLSLFSVVGLLAAYLSVVCWYPFLTKTASTAAVPRLTFLSSWLSLWQNPKLRLYLPLSLLVLSFIGFTTLRFDDDIRQLQALPENLKAQEEQIKTVSGVGQNQQLLLVRADSEQALLIRLEEVGEQLSQWKKHRVLSDYQSIAQYLPSEKTQKENFKLVESLYQRQGRRLSAQLNFSTPIRFESQFKLLTVQDFLSSSVSQSLGFLWLKEINGIHSAVILLHQVKDPGTIKAFINLHDDLTYLDKADQVSHIFKKYRVQISKLLIAAYGLISLLLIWRYGLKLGLLVIGPPVIAACAGLAVTSVVGIPITIFNLLALILILGIGIDYTLFFAEQNKTHAAKHTLLAITLSALTTVLSFGLLSLSETQAIHGFGITLLSGIIVAWILAPLAMKTRN
ncbi:MAG TPA: MMPL family transporter [Psychromonas sp.]